MEYLYRSAGTPTARWWLGGEVSNLRLRLQRTPCCRYTTPDHATLPTRHEAIVRHLPARPVLDRRPFFVEPASPNHPCGGYVTPVDRERSTERRDRLLEELPENGADLALAARLRPRDAGGARHAALGVRDAELALPAPPA